MELTPCLSLGLPMPRQTVDLFSFQIVKFWSRATSPPIWAQKSYWFGWLLPSCDYHFKGLSLYIIFYLRAGICLHNQSMIYLSCWKLFNHINAGHCISMYPYGLYMHEHMHSFCFGWGSNRQASFDNLKEARQNRALAQRQVHGPNSFKQQVRGRLGQGLRL